MLSIVIAMLAAAPPPIAPPTNPFGTGTAAEDPARWTATDTALQVAFGALLLTDWAQTRNTLARTPGGMPEGNPLLGAHPSELRLDGYFLGALLLHTTVARLLPHPWRTVWQIGWVGAEGVVAARNFSVGARIRF